MKVLVIVLNDLNYLENVLEKLITLNVKGATILDSEGMAKAILKNEGLNYYYKDIIGLGENSDIGSSKTIFTVVNDEMIEKVTKEIKELLSTSKEKTVGFMFSMPVLNVESL